MRVSGTSRLIDVAVPRSGTLCASGGFDKTVRVWDAHSGRPLGEPLKHGHKVRLMQFSPDGKRIVTTRLRGTVTVREENATAAERIIVDEVANSLLF